MKRVNGRRSQYSFLHEVSTAGKPPRPIIWLSSRSYLLVALGSGIIGHRNFGERAARLAHRPALFWLGTDCRLDGLGRIDGNAVARLVFAWQFCRLLGLS